MSGAASSVGNVFQKTYDALFKGEKPEAPQVAAPPPPPDPTNSAAELEDAASNQRKARGRASTYLTGASGLTTQATTASRTLLGS